MSVASNQEWRTGLTLLGLVVGVLLVVFLLVRNPAPEPPAATPDLPPAEAQAPPEAPPPAPVAEPGDPPKVSPATFRDAHVKEVSVEGERHRFTERYYSPPQLMPKLESKPSAGWHDTPENALASYTSAMLNADWRWFLSMWDTKSQGFISRNMAAGEKEPTAFIEAWKQEYAGRRMVLLRRIDMPGYVIVYLRRQDKPDDSPEALAPVALRKDEQGQWWFTHDLVDHAVYFYDSLREDAQVRIIQ